MSCALCARGSYPTHSGCATCATCGSEVCTDNCVRPDGHSHGGRCECGCPGTFCRPDLKDHVDDQHGGSVSNCFPPIGGRLSLDGFGTAVAAYYLNRLEDRASIEMTGVWNEFLNVVCPGSKALLEGRLPTGLYHVDEETWRPAGKMRVEFERAFYSEGTIERFTAVAAAELGVAVSHGYSGEDSRLYNAARKPLMQALRSRSRGFTPDFSASYLWAWLPQGVNRDDGWLRYVLSLPVPSSSLEIVDWLVEAAVGSSTPEPA